MKKYIILSLLTLIQVALIIALKGFSYPFLLLFILLFILTYISIEDWKTGLISIPLNFSVLAISAIFSFFNNIKFTTIGVNFLCFVLPFIVIEGIFQLFINKDKERFLIGGGDIILFASMSFILNTFNMAIMLFFACLFSLITSKIIKKSLIHFAPFVQIGFLIAFLFGDIINNIF